MTSRASLDDDVVDSLRAEWLPELGRPGLRVPDDAPTGVAVLRNMTAVGGPADLCLLAEGLEVGGTRATDAGGYRLVGQMAVAWDASGAEVTLSRKALGRLLARLLDAAVGGQPDSEDESRLADLSASLHSEHGRKGGRA